MRVAPLAGTIVDAAMRVFSDSDRNPLATQARRKARLTLLKKRNLPPFSDRS
jgi:hypothetical protein